jgi:hypothetical protein
MTTASDVEQPENTPTSGERDSTTGKFLPGRSGNKGGRPKVESRLRKLAQRHSKRAIERLVELMESRNPRVAVLACQAILDRGIGKPRQAIEVSTDPAAPPPQFNISFALGGPGNPLSSEEAAALSRASEPDGVEVSGNMSDVGEFDETPLSLPQPNSAAVHATLPGEAEPPRLAPDPARPDAVTIDADGTVWKQLLNAARGSPLGAEPPPETRAQSFVKRQEALAQRHREHEERNNWEAEQAREAQRIRAAKMGLSE